MAAVAREPQREAQHTQVGREETKPREDTAESTAHLGEPTTSTTPATTHGLTTGSSTRNIRTHRFFTFTLRHNDKPLKEQITRLYRCFKKLRNTQVWRDTQLGGAVMLEVKLAKDKNAAGKQRWHPHLHAVAEGKWIDNARLKHAWHEITGDSIVVDVRILPRDKDAANYVSKYVTKGTSTVVWHTQELADEWIKASKGIRFCSTFGTWRGFRLTAPS